MTQPQSATISDDVTVEGTLESDYGTILTEEALEFVARLHRRFSDRRDELLRRRTERQQAIDAGETLGFLDETRQIRDDDWEIAGVPDDLQRRTVEITGPTSRKMVINALNSGANCYMADFEDSQSPTWSNVIEGQMNLRDAIRRDIDFHDADRGKSYELDDETATLMVRPRGWHLDEQHLVVDGSPVPAGLVDFGLYFFHNAQTLLDADTGPYFYLPKLENHLEARLWNDVFDFAQQQLGIPQGTIKTTVLIETLPAAFEMDEILYELRDHIVGLNAGRWDYIFSAIKTFRNRDMPVFPDRGDITMTVPFMRAYTERLVQTCHRRSAHAIGGMAAFIPTGDPETNEVAFREVQQDKQREAEDGFDGTWVAHPGLVDVAREAFVEYFDDQPHQKDRMREDVDVSADELVDFEIPDAEITEEGMRTNINVGLQYIESWLGGVGAAAIFNLMEDAATAEISRSQVWQWLHRDDARLDDGRSIDRELYDQIVDEELDKIQKLVGSQRFENGRFDEARRIFDRVTVDDDFPEFFTLVAYDELDE